MTRTPALTLVTDAPETPAQAAARLQREASKQTRVAIDELLVSMALTEAAALAIADLEAAQPGIREECRQLTAQLTARADTIMAILGRGR